MKINYSLLRELLLQPILKQLGRKILLFHLILTLTLLSFQLVLLDHIFQKFFIETGFFESDPIRFSWNSEYISQQLYLLLLNFPRKRTSLQQKFEEENSGRPDITIERVIFISNHYFRSSIPEGTDNKSEISDQRVLDKSRQSEISKFHFPFLIHQNIGAFKKILFHCSKNKKLYSSRRLISVLIQRIYSKAII